MTDITPSDTQAEAIKAIEQWFKSLETDENGKLLPDQKQIFRVFGYAGSGKTTITKIAIQECGLSLDPLDNDTRFAAYTGKASLVMRRAGTLARTIHSLIYSVSQASDEEIENAKKKLAEMETAALQLSPGNGTHARRCWNYGASRRTQKDETATVRAQPRQRSQHG